MWTPRRPRYVESTRIDVHEFQHLLDVVVTMHRAFSICCFKVTGSRARTASQSPETIAAPPSVTRRLPAREANTRSHRPRRTLGCLGSPPERGCGRSSRRTPVFRREREVPLGSPPIRRGRHAGGARPPSRRYDRAAARSRPRRRHVSRLLLRGPELHVAARRIQSRWIGSIQRTVWGLAAAAMSRLTTIGS